jgi:hypothetical protein
MPVPCISIVAARLAADLRGGVIRHPRYADILRRAGQVLCHARQPRDRIKRGGRGGAIPPRDPGAATQIVIGVGRKAHARARCRRSIFADGGDFASDTIVVADRERGRAITIIFYR